MQAFINTACVAKPFTNFKQKKTNNFRKKIPTELNIFLQI